MAEKQQSIKSWSIWSSVGTLFRRLTWILCKSLYSFPHTSRKMALGLGKTIHKTGSEGRSVGICHLPSGVCETPVKRSTLITLNHCNFNWFRLILGLPGRWKCFVLEEIPLGGSPRQSRLNDLQERPPHHITQAKSQELEVETFLVRHRSAHNSRPPGRYDNLTDWICGEAAWRCCQCTHIRWKIEKKIATQCLLCLGYPMHNG